VQSSCASYRSSSQMYSNSSPLGTKPAAWYDYPLVVEATTTKKCTICGVHKPLTEFQKLKRKYLHSYCRSCLSDYVKRDSRWDRFGPLLVEKQGNTCAICGTEFTPKTIPCVDHCHITGKIRGALCYSCNVKLGFLEKDLVRKTTIRVSASFRAIAERYLSSS
jgi:hypothetical protein